jgi:hypothetical protein
MEHVGFELLTSGYCGGWALRGGRSARVGVASWPGAVRHRFAMQALGWWDALSEGGEQALLPRDEAATALAAALWPTILAEPLFATRILGTSTIGPDALRLLALAETLFSRLGAAAVLVLDEFQRSRSVAQAIEVAATHFARAAFAPLPPELALLLCRPWGGPGLSAPPDAVLAAQALAEALCRSYDVDWWRNPRSVEPLRQLWSRSASEPLEALVVDFDAGAAGESLRRWLEAKLGG